MQKKNHHLAGVEATRKCRWNKDLAESGITGTPPNPAGNPQRDATDKPDNNMKIAYADPPYLGCGKLYAAQHLDALDWDRPSVHERLIAGLCGGFPDGWALSLSSPSLATILPMCPPDCRVSAWVKPFAAFKANVGVAYAWEPVIWRGGRRRSREQDTVRDWVAESITLKRGLTGAKPRAFCRWLFEILGLQRGDEFVDLFPGTGAVTAAWQEWSGDHRPMRLFENETDP
jgi:hypothetical protein